MLMVISVALYVFSDVAWRTISKFTLQKENFALGTNKAIPHPLNECLFPRGECDLPILEFDPIFHNLLQAWFLAA